MENKNVGLKRKRHLDLEWSSINFSHPYHVANQPTPILPTPIPTFTDAPLPLPIPVPTPPPPSSKDDEDTVSEDDELHIVEDEETQSDGEETQSDRDEPSPVPVIPIALPTHIQAVVTATLVDSKKELKANIRATTRKLRGLVSPEVLEAQKMKARSIFGEKRPRISYANHGHRWTVRIKDIRSEIRISEARFPNGEAFNVAMSMRHLVDDRAYLDKNIKEIHKFGQPELFDALLTLMKRDNKIQVFNV